MPETPNLSEEYFCTFLQEHYALLPLTFEVLPWGYDSNATVYRVVTQQAVPYLLKIRRGLFYSPSCLVPRFLNDQGISPVVAPIPTNSHNLWSQINEWTIILYPFIEGDTSWDGITGAHWRETGAIFKKIHQVVLPAQGFEALRKETFDPTNYVGWVHNFEQQSLNVDSGSSFQFSLRSCWRLHQTRIEEVVSALERLSGMLRGRTLEYVLCHADLHPANLIRNQQGQVFVIDWDEVMLAPKERDFLFVETGNLESSPFFEGYGETEIDLVALNYFRFERVIQDLIACCEDIFYRDDLGEESKAKALQLFYDILGEGGECEMVFATLPRL